MKVEFDIILNENRMICTNSLYIDIGGPSMESEISITVNVDLTHILDIICIAALLLIIA